MDRFIRRFQRMVGMPSYEQRDALRAVLGGRGLRERRRIRRLALSGRRIDDPRDTNAVRGMVSIYLALWTPRFLGVWIVLWLSAFAISAGLSRFHNPVAPLLLVAPLIALSWGFVAWMRSRWQRTARANGWST